MSTLRINLHIRDDVSPYLYQTLIILPPRPRAEFLRRIAEIGLRTEHNPASSPETSKASVIDSRPEAHNGRAPDLASDCFGDDLFSAIRDSL